MPDAWESAYGLNPASPADAPLDLDGDGVSNLDEYLAGTNPADPSSYLKVERLTGVPGLTTIHFEAVSNKTYSVIYRDDLAAGTWLALTNLAAQPQSRSMLVTDPSPAPSRFYRLVTPRLP
jgi:hypothetical protein